MKTTPVVLKVALAVIMLAARVTGANSQAPQPGPLSPPSVLPLTGEDAKREAQRVRPLWGAAEAGLQLGIAIPTHTPRFKVGQRVPLELFVRNASAREVAFAYQLAIWPFDTLLNVPEVRNKQGKLLHVPAFGLGGLPAIRKEALAPGAVLVFRHPGLLLGRPGEREPSPSHPDTVLVDAAPGRYRLRHSVRLDVGSDVQAGNGFRGVQRLSSDEVSFEISPAPKDGGSPANASDPGGM